MPDTESQLTPDQGPSVDDSESVVDPEMSKLNPSDRHTQIKKLVQSSGFVTIDHLARQFDVTPQTIRRDINFLSKTGDVQRFHGGAGIASSIENVGYLERKIICFQEKQQIAQMVARHIPDNASLFINIGTTTEAIAQALTSHKRLRVITNNLNVATILASNQNFEIIVAGGMVRHRDFGLVGPLTIDFIQQFKVDFGIIGISGIDLDGTLLDFDYREVRASRAIIDNSRKIFLAADHTKFGRNAMVRLGNISEIDALFTDQSPPPALIEVMTRAEVGIHVLP
jgi:DeoR family transcriptional regulator, glycerol-3-phosphate regulon repressor